MMNTQWRLADRVMTTDLMFVIWRDENFVTFLWGSKMIENLVDWSFFLFVHFPFSCKHLEIFIPKRLPCLCRHLRILLNPPRIFSFFLSFSPTHTCITSLCLQIFYISNFTAFLLEIAFGFGSCRDYISQIKIQSRCDLCNLVSNSSHRLILFLIFVRNILNISLSSNFPFFNILIVIK